MDYTNAVSGGHPELSTTKKNQNALALLNFVRIDVSFEIDRYRDQSFGSRRSLRENLEDGNFRCKVIFGYNRERERERERESVYVGVRECVHVCVCVRLREKEREREKGAVAESQMRWNYVIAAAALTSSVLCDFFGFADSYVTRK